MGICSVMLAVLAVIGFIFNEPYRGCFANPVYALLFAAAGLGAILGLASLFKRDDRGQHAVGVVGNLAGDGDARPVRRFHGPNLLHTGQQHAARPRCAVRDRRREAPWLPRPARLLPASGLGARSGVNLAPADRIRVR